MELKERPVLISTVFYEEVLVPTRNETHFLCYRVQYDQIKTTSPEVIISNK